MYNALVPSSIFAFGQMGPFKAVLELPNKGKLDKKTVNFFLKKSQKSPLPTLPPGTFIRHRGGVYIYKHQNADGCRSTDSYSHSCLPEASRQPVESLPVSKIGMGDIYFNNRSTYTIVDEANQPVKVLKLGEEQHVNVKLQVVIGPMINVYQATETDRTYEMRQILQKCMEKI